MAGSTGVLPRAQGLSAAAARDLRQARHPADLRRGHHRLRPARPRLRGRTLRRRARHDHLRQGHHVRRRADGRRDRAQGDLRRLHARPRARGRAVPRLYLFGPSARLRRRPRDARPLSRRGLVRARAEARADLGGRGDEPQGPAQRARHPLRRAHRRHRPRLAPGRRRQARLRRDGARRSTRRTWSSASPARPSRSRRR